MGQIFRLNPVGPSCISRNLSPKGCAMDMEDAPSSTTMCALRAMRSSNRIQKRGELSALWLSVALRNWTSGRLAGDRGREGVTYCILWGVERSQMDFICLVRCSSGLSLSFLSLCAHYNPLLLLQLTLISTSTRVSCLLLLLSDSALALNSSRPNVLREI